MVFVKINGFLTLLIESLHENQRRTHGSTSQGAQEKRACRAAIVAHARTERSDIEVCGAD